MSGGFFLKKKIFFFAITVCLHFEQPVEVVQMKTTHSFPVVFTQKKSLTPAGKVTKGI